MSDSAPTATAFNNPRVMDALVRSLKRPPRFLLDTFFKAVKTFNTRQVTVDVELKGVRAAAYCPHDSEGTYIKERGFASNEFRTGYIKEIIPLPTEESFSRRAGESFGAGDMTPGDRTIARQVDATLDSVNAILTAKEIQAASILINGTVTLTGPGMPGVTLAFGRDPALTLVNGTGLAASAPLWDNALADGAADLESSTSDVMLAGGGKVAAYIMDQASYNALIKQPTFKDKLNKLLFSGASATIGFNADIYQYVSVKGYLGDIPLVVYQGFYEVFNVDGTTTQVPILPRGTVIGASEFLLGQQLHGAIQDEAAALKALEIFTKSWYDERIGNRVVQVQSAPLVAPFRPNASFSRKVLAS